MKCATGTQAAFPVIACIMGSQSISVSWHFSLVAESFIMKTSHLQLGHRVRQATVING